MTAVSTMVGGFLAAVLWFDLMFDVQVLGQPVGALHPSILESIRAYYQRALIDASPMGRIVGTTMLVGWVSVGLQLRRRELEGGIGWITAAALFLPTGLAVVRVVPNAARLATGSDPLTIQSELARAIFQDHLVCLASIALFLALQLFQSRRRGRRTQAHAAG